MALREQPKPLFKAASETGGGKIRVEEQCGLGLSLGLGAIPDGLCLSNQAYFLRRGELPRCGAQGFYPCLRLPPTMGVVMKLYLLALKTTRERLRRYFRQVGIAVKSWGSAQQLPVHDERNGLLAVICFSADSILECHHPAVIPILFSQQPLTVTAMLEALANGSVDCWSTEMSSADLTARGHTDGPFADPCWRSGDSPKRKGGSRLSDLEQELQDDQRAGQQIQLGMLPISISKWVRFYSRAGCSFADAQR